MSQAVFPTMPGLKWGAVKTPMWSTKIQRSASGRELRAAYYSAPLWKISLNYEVLRSGALAELETMVGFFNARRGSFDNFLYVDPEDNVVVNQAFGIAEAGQTQYQLVRSYGGFVEPVLAPQLTGSGAVSIAVNGVPQTADTHYTMATDGLVTFLTPLTAGHVLSWSGEFFYRVRFVQDSADFERFLYQLWALKKIEIQTVRDRS
ncbi:MAG: DUF2460 domain-containing protein [Limnohabitans sp.]